MICPLCYDRVVGDGARSFGGWVRKNADALEDLTMAEIVELYEAALFEGL